MSRRIAPTARPASRAQTVYFAFGSNLQLSQMARRCPESRYLGRGMLLGYKWQINTRGYANIYESPSNTVEGLCFLLSKNDEERLDRSEGVRMVPSAYEKGIVDVIVYPSSPLIVGRRVHEVNNFIRENSCPSSNSITGGGEEVKALVYLSHRDIGDGPPKLEYIDRINTGIQDAMLLGVPASYFDQNVHEPLSRIFPATESVPQNRSFQDQRKDTSLGERSVRSYKSGREFTKPSSSDGDLGRHCSHRRYTSCRDCSASDKRLIGRRTRAHSLTTKPGQNLA